MTRYVAVYDDTGTLPGNAANTTGSASDALLGTGVFGPIPASGGTVTSVSVSTANGVSGSVANPTTTPDITLTLGAITPSSVNGNTISTGTGTLTLGSKVLTVSNSLTLAGTDSTTMTFPSTSATIARTDSANTFTGTQTADGYALSSSGIITDATTTRTLSSGDNGKVIYFTSSSAITVTTATSLGAGFSCRIIQGGTGIITAAQGASTTLGALGNILTTAGQYGGASFFCPVADTFVFCTQGLAQAQIPGGAFVSGF